MMTRLRNHAYTAVAATLSLCVLATLTSARAAAPEPVVVGWQEAGEHLVGLRPAINLPEDDCDLIMVDAVIDAAGNVESAQVSARSPQKPQFHAEALRRARAVTFKPFMRDGVPVAAKVVVDVVIKRDLDFRSTTEFPAFAATTPTRIALLRGACYGTCPGYAIEISDDGSVVYRGDAFVAARGAHRYRIPRDAVLEILGLLRDAQFFGMAEIYRSYCIISSRNGEVLRGAFGMDGPTHKITVKVGEQSKEVTHYSGLEPLILRQIEDRIDVLAQSERWVLGTSGLVEALDSEAFVFSSPEATSMLTEVLNINAILSSRVSQRNVDTALQTKLMENFATARAFVARGARLRDSPVMLRTMSSHAAVGSRQMLDLYLDAGLADLGERYTAYALAWARRTEHLEAVERLGGKP